MDRNATHAFLDALRRVLAHGERVVSRGQSTLELRGHVIRVERPLERIYVIRHRNNNVFAALAETFWVLAGRNDLAFLQQYLPRAADFSDDGVVWRGGYGPRLRGWKGAAGATVDQLHEVARLLRDAPDSRRAVMVIYDPAQDFVESRDIPCNNWLHFLVRDGRLHLSAAVRSNDVIWGLSGINTFEWSVLLEMMAFWTGTQPGSYTQFIGSLHLYERHEGRARRMLRAARPRTLYEYGIEGPRFQTPLAAFDAELDRFFAVEAAIRAGERGVADRIGAVADPFVRATLQMLHLYDRFRRGAPADEIVALVAALPPSDLRVAAVEYLTRPRKGKDEDGEPRVTPLDRALFPLTPAEAAFFAEFTAPGGAATVAQVYETLRVLHYRKTLKYGDSWKKHGELLGVFANITRKFDRLENDARLRAAIAGEEDAARDAFAELDADEMLVDTFADLAVYAGKYLTFLAERHPELVRGFLADAGAATDLAPYRGNEGFDPVTALLLERLERSPVRDAASLAACWALIEPAYRTLESLLVTESWDRPDPRKCTAAAELSLAAARALAILSGLSPAEYRQFLKKVDDLPGGDPEWPLDRLGNG